MLLKANEGGGFQSRQKAFLPARSQCSQGQPEQQPNSQGGRPWRDQRLCRQRGLQRRALGCQVVKIVKG